MAVLLQGGVMEQITTTAAVAPRGVDAGRGINWWTEAWALFIKNPGMWVVLSLILLVALIVLSLIPLLGSLAASFVAPVFAGSWMLAARKVEAGGTLEPADLLTGFKEKQTPLLVLGGLLVVATLVIVALVGALGFSAAMGMVVGGSQGSAGGMMAAMGTGMLALLAGAALSVLVAMAFWFAPALVVFRNVAPVEALKASFAANLKNWIAFLLYSVVYLFAAVIASIPFGLGWIVLIPVSLLTVYVSYQDVFGN
jgi:uncharacterized membrane protein